MNWDAGWRHNGSQTRAAIEATGHNRAAGPLFLAARTCVEVVAAKSIPTATEGQSTSQPLIAAAATNRSRWPLTVCASMRTLVLGDPAARR
jgi:hypothetical protein